MMNRLISLNPEVIKKEQIIFLGDIMTSNRSKQFDKLLKLKEFLLDKIALFANSSKDLSDPDQ